MLIILIFIDSTKNFYVKLYTGKMEEINVMGGKCENAKSCIKLISRIYEVALEACYLAI